MLSIASQGYSAVVNVRGAELISLQFRGRHVVVPGDVNQPNSAYRGSVLAPWPNRLADGRYRYDGVDYQVVEGSVDARVSQVAALLDRFYPTAP